MSAIAAPAALLRWSPTCRSGSEVRELGGGPFTADELPSVFRQVASDLTGCTMLIIRVAQLDSGGLATAVDAVRAAELSAHVCLAVDRATLARLDLKVRTSKSLGLLLDNVDSGTPLADVVHEAVEAIRFDLAFARKASQHLRSECILQAMLGLARNAGLCTLGPAPRSGEQTSPTLEFDYVR
jgi:hypothetical protein